MSEHWYVEVETASAVELATTASAVKYSAVSVAWAEASASGCDVPCPDFMCIILPWSSGS